MRRIGSSQRTRQRAKTRAGNNQRKARERASRDRRMVQSLQAGSLPFLPWVMSWLNRKLDKPSLKITQADIDQLLATESAKMATAGA